MKTGLAYIAVAGTSIVWAMVAQQLVTRVGVKPVLVTGMSLLALGLVYFTQVSPDGSYVSDLLPGFLVVAMGMAFSFVSISIAALAGVPAKDAASSAGRINDRNQSGGARDPVLSSVWLSLRRTTRRGPAIAVVPNALASGFQAAFWVGAGIAAVGVVASLILVRRDELEAAPVAEGSDAGAYAAAAAA